MNLSFIKRLACTSIGRKAVMAATGLMLGLFMLIHLAENLLLLKGEIAFNTWVDFLLSNPLLPFLEVGLAFIFALHIITGIWVSIENWIKAQPLYEVNKWQGGRNIASATMPYTAILIIAYLVYHMITFRFSDHSMGFYQMVATSFRKPVFTYIYIGGAAVLALHLSHGMQSAFQTLGLDHPRYTPFIKLGGLLTAACMLGFALISLYFLTGKDLLAAQDIYQVVIQ